MQWSKYNCVKNRSEKMVMNGFFFSLFENQAAFTSFHAIKLKHWSEKRKKKSWTAFNRKMDNYINIKPVKTSTNLKFKINHLRCVIFSKNRSCKAHVGVLLLWAISCRRDKNVYKKKGQHCVRHKKPVWY